ncbi:Uncharacterised protein [Shigella sonnei]|nr:Uncharacterised protein [Shigella sonnei]CSP28544.1 Uncharacterised protein [Shigella sonnei]CSR49867.1 Uncharacterised protein [Shigella sonnei]
MATGGRHFAIHFVDRFGVPANGARRAGNIITQTVTNRFAGVESFQQCQLFGVGFH